MRRSKGKDTKKKENDKGRKLKSAKSSGNTAQGQSPESEPVSYYELPEDFSFLWSIDAIKTKYDGKYPPRILGVGNKNDVAKLWFPPTRSKQFRVVTPGGLYRWTPKGNCEKLSGVDRPPKKYAVASIFFQAKQDNFVACYHDCTSEDLVNLDVGWCYLGFNHLGEGLSEVEICSRADYDVLSATAKDSTWMPQLLPAVYDNRKFPGGNEYADPIGGLCGRLALLIGMAAFSASEEHAEAVVSQCFKFGDWIRHDAEIGIGRYQERGVVVSIYLDPNATNITAAHLRAFEKGKYGPIFFTEPDEQEPESPPPGTMYGLSNVAGLSTTGPSIPRAWDTRTSSTYSYTLSPVTSRLISPSVTQSAARSETEEGDDRNE